MLRIGGGLDDVFLQNIESLVSEWAINSYVSRLDVRSIVELSLQNDLWLLEFCVNERLNSHLVVSKVVFIHWRGKFSPFLLGFESLGIVKRIKECFFGLIKATTLRVL